MLNIKENISLSEFTTFKIGGPAKFFVEIKNEEELLEAVNYAKSKNLDFFLLAGGSNILVSDSGFDGLAIRLLNTEIKFNNDEVECDSGSSLMKLVSESVKNNLTGLEWAAGIPGTVGGAIVGNAGAFGGEIKNNLLEVRFFDIEAGVFSVYPKEDCNFSYRNSVFKSDKKKIIVSAKFKLIKNRERNRKNDIKEIIKKRKDKQPQYPSAGSFFKNPVVTNRDIIDNFEKDTGLKIKDNKIPAGWFTESLGLKGKMIGGAQISEKHANFIINAGNATAEDVIILSSLIKQKVRDRFGIQLEEEVRMIGF